MRGGTRSGGLAAVSPQDLCNRVLQLAASVFEDSCARVITTVEESIQIWKQYDEESRSI